ncbi:MAG: hypothetical protein O3C57_00935, partial [Verrucomicrobia bacterium]|nr:hypothetical protein [Verrucomicrobiota bacterium]
MQNSQRGMSTRKSARLLLCALLGIAALQVWRSSAAEDDRLVRVQVSNQNNDPFHPWQTSAPGVQAGYGFQIDASHILTTERLVRNHTLVEIMRPRSAHKVSVAVVMSDHRLNLALLEMPALPTILSKTMIDMEENIRLGDQLEIIQMDDIRDMQSGPVRVQQIRVGRLPDSPNSLLEYSLLCSLNVNAEGAPVMKDGRLVGVTIAFDPRTRIATMVAAPFVSRFIQDTLHPPYQGLASAGFSWKPLIDPVKRRFLKLDDPTNGILVLGALPGTEASGVLERMDVILEWDGHPVDSLGFYEDRTLGRTDFSHLIKAHRHPGDHVKLLVYRDGKRVQLELQLVGNMDNSVLVPENVTATRAEYIVAGGFVLRELDMNYLRSHGSNWRSKVDSRLLNAYLSGRKDEHLASNRIVIVTDMLSDAINEGYNLHRREIVTHVNRQDVRTLGDVFRIHDA